MPPPCENLFSPPRRIVERKIGNYRIVEYIGGGGFGSVFKAEDTTSPGRIVAIKELHRKHTRSQVIKQRFFQEALAMARLSHPNLPQIYSFGEEDGCYYLVMEFISGRPLSEQIERYGAMPPERAIAIMGQVLSAVGYAHRCGIIHRDLKPDNIMLVGDADAVKVLDFGIAKILWGEKITLSRQDIGTPSYMSPERLAGSSQIDHRTDIYSLGIIMFEMLSGHVPFESKATDPVTFWAEMRKLHLEAELPSLAPFGVPPELEQAVRKAAAKRPEDRYATAEDMLAALGSKPRSASLLLSIAPSPAEVFVDDLWRGSSDQATGRILISNLTPGAHNIRVSKRGYEPYSIDLLVPDGQQVELRVALAARQTVAICSRPATRENEDLPATMKLCAASISSRATDLAGRTTQPEGPAPKPRRRKLTASVILAALLAGLALATYLLIARHPPKATASPPSSNQNPAPIAQNRLPVADAPPLQESNEQKRKSKDQKRSKEAQPAPPAIINSEACIAVLVTDPNGDPVREARIFCLEEVQGSTPILHHGRTNQNGIWHACGFTAGQKILFRIRRAGIKIGQGQAILSPGRNFIQIQARPDTTRRPFRAHSP
jgi:serine/threonine protein kinase